MRRRTASILPQVVLLAMLVGATLAGCTGSSAHGAHVTTTSPVSQSNAGNSHVTRSIGSPGHPLLVSCDAEALPYPTGAPVTAGPRDLAVGPMYMADALALATQTPALHGYTPLGHHGRFYKLAFVVRPGATVTVTIGADARGHVVIAAPGVGDLGIIGVTSATYRACPQAGGFFAQGFVFTRPPFRGCVPLEVRVDDQARARHVTLSMFAGTCDH